jgi:hypothetical protein
VVDGLSRILNKAKCNHHFQGLSIGRNIRLSHLLFFYDVLIFCFYRRNEGRILQEILKLFFDATSMIINVAKSTIYFPGSIM